MMQKFLTYLRKKSIVTHSGGFHADEIFAVAVLAEVLEQQGYGYRIIRTRDPKIIESGDYVVDVGGVYNPEKNRFDHHQKDKPEPRHNGVPYASFGLVWKTFGPSLVGSQEGSDLFDRFIVQSIDGPDNGTTMQQNLFEGIGSYGIHGIIHAHSATWQESKKNRNSVFNSLVRWARMIIKREIIHTQALLQGYEKVREIYNTTEDKSLIVLPEKYPWETILVDMPEPLYVMYPETEEGVWRIAGVRKNRDTFELRKPFPQEWAGLRDDELVHMSGVSDAVFCHNARFLCVAKNKESALELAKTALKR